MDKSEILEQIKNLSNSEKRNIKQQELVNIMQDMTVEEIIELSKIIGYPVFARLCMGELNHKFVLLQDGAAAVIVNTKGEILLQRRTDKDLWGLPGGCQELGEDLRVTATREAYEETGIKLNPLDIELIDTLSGESRKNSYPNGDIVYNNTSLYLADVSITDINNLKCDSETKRLKFFNINDIPENIMDIDLINAYKSYNKSKIIK